MSEQTLCPWCEQYGPPYLARAEMAEAKLEAAEQERDAALAERDRLRDSLAEARYWLKGRDYETTLQVLDDALAEPAPSEAV